MPYSMSSYDLYELVLMSLLVYSIVSNELQQL